MVELSKATAAHLREEAWKAEEAAKAQAPLQTTPSGNTPALEPQGSATFSTPTDEKVGHRPDKPDSQAKVAEAIGLSQSTLSLAERHVDDVARLGSGHPARAARWGIATSTAPSAI